jgi:hypothetical protein
MLLYHSKHLMSMLLYHSKQSLPPLSPSLGNMETICKINEVIDTDDLKIEDFPSKLIPYKAIGCYEDGTIYNNENYHLSASRLFEAIVNRECFIASFSTTTPSALSNFIVKYDMEEFVFWFKKNDGMVTSFPWVFLVPQEVRSLVKRNV